MDGAVPSGILTYTLDGALISLERSYTRLKFYKARLKGLYHRNNIPKINIQ